MLVVLAGPVNHEAPVRLKGLQQNSLCDVPGHTSEKDTGRVGGILVSAGRKLTAPCADHLWTYWVGRGEGRGV